MLKTRLLVGALIAFGAPFIASAQCPAGVTPANYLIGKTWAFRLTGPPPIISLTSAIGTFTGVAPGYLSIVETVVDVLNSNQISRQAPATGRWSVNSSCSGGELQFMLNREFFTIQFTLADAGTTMNLSGLVDRTIPVIFPRGYPLMGIARLSPPRACPAGLGNPHNLLNGVKYAYTATGGGYIENGVLTGSFPNPAAYSGNLSIDRTVIDVAGIRGFEPNYPTQGRYTIYGDCSGGSLALNANRKSIQVEFVFSKADFSELFFLGDDLLQVNNPFTFSWLPYAGIATRQ